MTCPKCGEDVQPLLPGMYFCSGCDSLWKSGDLNLDNKKLSVALQTKSSSEELEEEESPTGSLPTSPRTSENGDQPTEESSSDGPTRNSKNLNVARTTSISLSEPSTPQELPPGPSQEEEPSNFDS